MSGSPPPWTRLSERLDLLLPSTLDGEARLRVRMGSAMSLLVGVTLLAFAPAFWAAELVAVAAGCVVAGLVAVALAAAWARLGHGVSLQLLLLMCFALETYAVLTHGGADSPFLAFVLFPVLYAGLLGTPRMTLAWGVFGIAYAASFQLVPSSWDVGETPDPGIFWLIAVTPMVFISGGIVAYVSEASRRERAEARAAQQQAEAAYAAAEKASRAKSDFLAIASHELRSPLAGILGAAELLRNRPEDVAHLAEVIARSGERMAALVDDLLDVKRIERGEMRLADEVFDPREVLGDLVELHEVEARARGVKLALAIDDSVPSRLRGDEGRVRQIVTNLVSNAIKFSRDAAVRISARGALVIDVEDDGPGIDPEVRAAIFEPFVRADSGPDRNASGTGLGLAVSRGLAEAMGGTLEALEASVGAHFRLRVDLPEAAAEPVASATPGDNALQVLVVDDDPTSRLVTVGMVELVGHHPTQVSSGQAAIDACATTLPDVVLLDWHMPGLDGFATAAQLKARWPGLEVVGYTASTAPDERQRATEAGMVRTLRKPVSLAALRTALATLAER